MYVCMHVSAYVPAYGSQRSVFLKCHPPYFLRQGLTRECGGLLIGLNCLASEPQEPSSLHLPFSGITGVQHHTFYVIADRAELVQQVPYKPSYLPRPQSL